MNRNIAELLVDLDFLALSQCRLLSNLVSDLLVVPHNCTTQNIIREVCHIYVATTQA